VTESHVRRDISIGAEEVPAPVESAIDRENRSVAGHLSRLVPEVSFPDVPRMAFEELVGQLTDRAKDVLAAQGRLRSLLLANAAVVSDLSLPVVLRHIVTAAQDLVHARFGALGVIGPNGRLEQFIHVGMDKEVVDRIGDLPTGEGVLGVLIRSPDPLRLTDLRDHPAAVGFPAHHPPMGSFLGVPIRVRGHVFGNLYLTDSATGEFSADDEQLVTALADTAGIAIANARLHQETLEQRRWLDVSSELTRTLFARATEPSLDVMLRLAMRAAKSDMATFAAPLDDQSARVEAAAGAMSDRAGTILDLDNSLVGRVIRTGKPILIGDYAAEFDSGKPDDLPDGIGAVIGVPLLSADSVVLGALTVAHSRNRAHFTEIDRDHLAGFAEHASVTLQLEKARREHESLLQVEDHDRIAADLHDHVIQELFAIGFGLQGMIKQLPRSDQRARVTGYVDALDRTIGRVRTTIDRLHTDPDVAASLSQRVLAVLDERAGGGPASDIEFVGPVDDLSAALHDDVIAVLREAMSIAVRHSLATEMRVCITVVDNMLTLDVSDNGIGIGESASGKGIANMRRLAESHAGAVHYASASGKGTHLKWTASCPPSESLRP
jgi:GAF domain-containing protein